MDDHSYRESSSIVIEDIPQTEIATKKTLTKKAKTGLSGGYVQDCLYRSYATMKAMEKHTKDYAEHPVYNELLKSLNNVFTMVLDENKKFKLDFNSYNVGDSTLVEAMKELSSSNSKAVDILPMKGLAADLEYNKLIKSLREK